MGIKLIQKFLTDLFLCRMLYAFMDYIPISLALRLHTQPNTVLGF